MTTPTTMDTPALAPCPFCCSSDVALSDSNLDELGRICIACGQCESTGPKCENPFRYPNLEQGIETARLQAIATWNQRNTWQQIETAPRDGTEIIGLFPCERRRRIVWFARGRWTDDDHHSLIDPTHWQPLPNPPTVTS
jgi:hypothetical protein